VTSAGAPRAQLERMTYAALLRILAKMTLAEDEGDRVVGELAALALTDEEEAALWELERNARWN
jgi:hypothetical protein